MLSRHEATPHPFRLWEGSVMSIRETGVGLMRIGWS
jgi:hypothetical protein